MAWPQSMLCVQLQLHGHAMDDEETVDDPELLLQMRQQPLAMLLCSDALTAAQQLKLSWVELARLCMQQSACNITVQQHICKTQRQEAGFIRECARLDR